MTFYAVKDINDCYNYIVPTQEYVDLNTHIVCYVGDEQTAQQKSQENKQAFLEQNDYLFSINKEIVVDLYDLKKKLWLAINNVNALEGIRFYVSFACSWAFAELKKMEGNAKIIKFIARDENLHLASTQTLLKLLPKDDPDFEKIEVECRDQAIKLFQDAVEQEKKWAEYLFKET